MSLLRWEGMNVAGIASARQTAARKKKKKNASVQHQHVSSGASNLRAGAKRHQREREEAARAGHMSQLQRERYIERQNSRNLFVSAVMSMTSNRDDTSAVLFASTSAATQPGAKASPPLTHRRVTGAVGSGSGEVRKSRSSIQHAGLVGGVAFPSPTVESHTWSSTPDNRRAPGMNHHVQRRRSRAGGIFDGGLRRRSSEGIGALQGAVWARQELHQRIQRDDGDDALALQGPHGASACSSRAQANPASLVEPVLGSGREGAVCHGSPVSGGATPLSRLERPEKEQRPQDTATPPPQQARGTRLPATAANTPECAGATADGRAANGRSDDPGITLEQTAEAVGGVGAALPESAAPRRRVVLESVNNNSHAVAPGQGDAQRNVASHSIWPSTHSLCSWFYEFTIYPGSQPWACWEIFILSLVLYNAVVLPYYFAYETNGAIPPPSMEAFDAVVDYLFVIDLGCNFFVGFIDEWGSLVVARKEIAKAYLSTYFWVDLCACVPFEAFLTSTGEDDNAVKYVNILKPVIMLQSTFSD